MGGWNPARIQQSVHLRFGFHQPVFKGHQQMTVDGADAEYNPAAVRRVQQIGRVE